MCGRVTQDVGAVTPPRSPAGPTATILLCTLNGERFLDEQLGSLKRQSFTNWKLIASDDGSSDRTRAILQAFKESQYPGRVEIVDGPQRGAAANFLSLACQLGPARDYYAFCDQDDIWEADKLARAISTLEQIDSAVPLVYGSRTRLIDAEGREIGLSPLFSKAPTFRCALVQSIAGGNTMVFNEKARELLAFGGADMIVPSHDWWLFQVVSACGGRVHYDAVPSVRYRQHGQNVIGANTGFDACVRRLHMLGQGRFRHWSDLNIAALARMRRRMTAESRQIFDLFCAARHRPTLQRAAMFAQAGLYRQTLFGNVGLAVAVALGKI
jgi:glycosyltransferase involved in cell wall biosynthesis